MKNETRITNEDGILRALWRPGLSDKELEALANGISPYLIRPKNLVYFAPLLDLGEGEENNG